MVLVGLIDIPVIEILLFLSVIIFLLLIESIIILVLLIKQLQKAKGEHQHQAPPSHPIQHHHKKKAKKEVPDRNFPDSGNMPLKEGYVPGKPAASALPPQSPPFRSTIISNLPSSPPPSDSPMEKNARSSFFSKKSNIRFSRDWLRR